jgi:signal transduction histidine kinase
VVLGAHVQDGLLRVEVVDAGPGLGGKRPGWGVGLALAEAALARLGGRLEVEERPQGGVRAWADLPLAEGGG